MGYFQIRYDSRGINYDRRGFIRLATGQTLASHLFAIARGRSLVGTLTIFPSTT